MKTSKTILTGIERRIRELKACQKVYKSSLAFSRLQVDAEIRIDELLSLRSYIKSKKP